MNSRDETNGLGERWERPKFVRGFHHVFQADPDIVIGETDMFPAKRGRTEQQMVRDIFSLAYCIDGAFQISCVPQDDRGAQEIQAGGAVLLVLVGVITDFTEPVHEDCPGQAVAGLAFVEFPPRRVSLFGIFDPVKSEQCAFQPPQLAQRGRDAILARV